MFWDEEYIDEKVEELKSSIENGTFSEDKCNNYISYNDLEDCFSHNEIDEAQEMFMNEVRQYLSKNHSGKYAMWCDWCVHITTVELYRDIMWKDNNYRKEYRIFKEKRDIII